MKNTIKLVSVLACILLAASCKDNTTNVNSPDKQLNVTVQIQEGQLGYEILKNEVVVLEFSKLGIQLDKLDFSSNLKIKSVSPSTPISDNYKLYSGKKLNCSYTANQRIYTIQNQVGEEMDIIFVVANDGVAFRYNIKGSQHETHTVTGEHTSFNFAGTAKAWLHPREEPQSGWCRTQPSYETNYQQNVPVGTKSTYGFGWTYPALFKTDNAWVLVSETDLSTNYCGTQLAENTADGEFTIELAGKVENMENVTPLPESTLPWTTPWRLLIIGDNLGTVVESTLATDISTPHKEGNWDFVKPGTASWSWAMLKDDATIYSVQKEFIDYAAEMKWPYCLIDAFWDTQIGVEKIEELSQYAQSKQVGLWLWYNSAGNWNSTPLTPRSRLIESESRKKEFEWLRKTGIKGIKVDFFAGDGQSMIKYYQDILTDAAEYGLMLNFHGATIPRGWTRTYPNLMTMESVKGFEYITFEQANADVAANHCCMLPFTRNVIGPMDFTPICFAEIPNIKRTTSNAFELALAVVFESGVQHIVETPAGMKTVPDYVRNLLTGFPSAWDETMFIDGYPGEYVVMARKKAGTWYVGGINGQNKAMTLEVDLSFMNKDTVNIIVSGSTNREFARINQSLTTNKKVSISLNANDGFTIY